MIIATPSFSKSSVFKMLSVRAKTKEKPALSNSSDLTSVSDRKAPFS